MLCCNIPDDGNSMSNPNPSPETRFGAGNKANPQGKTSEQRRTEIENAKKAVELRGRILDGLLSVTDGMDPSGLLQHLDPGTLKMLKDAEDRGLGAPVQAVAHTSPDGSMSPKDVSPEAARTLADKLTG